MQLLWFPKATSYGAKRIDTWGMYQVRSRVHASNKNWVMGPLSVLPNPTALDSSTHIGNVEQNHRVTQQ